MLHSGCGCVSVEEREANAGLQARPCVILTMADSDAVFPRLEARFVTRLANFSGLMSMDSTRKDHLVVQAKMVVVQWQVYCGHKKGVARRG